MFEVTHKADDTVQIILCQPDGRAEGKRNWKIDFRVFQVSQHLSVILFFC